MNALQWHQKKYNFLSITQIQWMNSFVENLAGKAMKGQNIPSVATIQYSTNLGLNMVFGYDFIWMS